MLTQKLQQGLWMALHNSSRKFIIKNTATVLMRLSSVGAASPDNERHIAVGKESKDRVTILGCSNTTETHTALAVLQPATREVRNSKSIQWKFLAN